MSASLEIKSMLNASAIFEAFSGIWAFKRTINQVLRVEGLAKFSRISPTQLTYREQGIYSLNINKNFNIERAYEYHIQAGVLFIVDSRYRVRQALKLYVLNGCLHADLSYRCLQDHYQASYSFYRHDRFMLRYQVHGPHKQYFIETYFSKTY